MATDEAMLEGASSRQDLGYFRVYAWERPTLSLGFAQSLARGADEERCRRTHVDVVRRITGGRAVLHHRELTYAVALPLAWVGDGSLRACYGMVSAALHQALRDLGVPAERSDPCARGKGGIRRETCFASTAPDEIHVGGRKLVGSAQRRGSRAFLQHGSVLLHADAALHLEASGEPPAADTGWVGVVEVTGRAVLAADLSDAVSRELVRLAGCRLLEAGAGAAAWEPVSARARELLPKHRSREWIARVP